jgi:hypothetical protein
LEILKGENLIDNGDFSKGNIGEMPDGWEIVCPNPAIAPIFKMAKLGEGNSLLMAEGNGRQECFGYVRHSVKLEPNKTYRMRVSLKFEGMDDLNRHLLHGVFGSFNDGIFEYSRDCEWVIGENRFKSTEQAGNNEVRLYFRFSPHGKVWWYNVSIQECEPTWTIGRNGLTLQVRKRLILHYYLRCLTEILSQMLNLLMADQEH